MTFKRVNKAGVAWLLLMLVIALLAVPLAATMAADGSLPAIIGQTVDFGGADYGVTAIACNCSGGSGGSGCC